MKTNIVSRDFELTGYIKDHVESELSHILGWNWRKVQNVTVTLGDTNGPRGGVDKYCRVCVELTSGHTIRAERVARDLYDAISQAATVAQKNVQTTIARERSKSRRAGLGMLF